ncbi:hypothetical protein EVAR_68548_1 [Eumeta japonica]|uniref:Uncharacterized protein n=1 Tax=Eumeta variegata TaxID=151549 RepID=A0A4C2A315_EUMVA|nr:hypothetical protein EVAR_68548_1 [Eumeta japonica]
MEVGVHAGTEFNEYADAFIKNAVLKNNTTADYWFSLSYTKTAIETASVEEYQERSADRSARKKNYQIFLSPSAQGMPDSYTRSDDASARANLYENVGFRTYLYMFKLMRVHL